MRLLILDPGQTRIIATGTPTQQGAIDACANPSWTGLTIAWTYTDTGSGVPTDLMLVDRANPTMPVAKETLPAYAFRRAWEILQAGTVTTMGYAFSTADGARRDIAGPYASTIVSSSNAISTLRLPNGSYVSLNSAAIRTLHDALVARWVLMADRNKQCDAGIANGTVTSQGQIEVILNQAYPAQPTPGVGSSVSLILTAPVVGAILGA